jgi:hypothetical protein
LRGIDCGFGGRLDPTPDSAAKLPRYCRPEAVATPGEAGGPDEEGETFVIRSKFRNLALAALLTLSSNGGALAAEILLYVVPDPKEPYLTKRELRTAEGQLITVVSEPVARVPAESIREATIVSEQIDLLDDEDTVAEQFRVSFVLDDARQAELSKTMKEICTKYAGVFLATDDTVLEFFPFVVCGHITVGAAFPDRKAAEDFAKKFSPKSVRVVTPPKE